MRQFSTGRPDSKWSQTAELCEYATESLEEDGIGVATRPDGREQGLAEHPELSDEWAVALARSDQRYFGLLYERYADRLYWYAAVRTGSAALADDVVSETIVTVIEQIDRFDARKGSFAAWLFTIAHHKVIDHHRYHQRLRRFLIRSGHRLELAEEEDALDRVLRSERAGQLYGALQRLSPADQEIIALRHSAELSSQAIAEILNVSPPAARKRLSRAMGRLDEQLRSEGRAG